MVVGPDGIGAEVVGGVTTCDAGAPEPEGDVAPEDKPPAELVTPNDDEPFEAPEPALGAVPAVCDPTAFVEPAGAVGSTVPETVTVPFAEAAVARVAAGVASWETLAALN